MINLADIIKAIWAGVAIAIGCMVYLSVDNVVVGSLLFTFGLFMVCANNFNLFTGKIGYLAYQGCNFIPKLITIWLGNLTGTLLAGNLILYTRFALRLQSNADRVVQLKLQDGPISIFILAFFCGILMYLAVDGHRSIEHQLGKYLALFLGVSVFILCGFEHCIANMAYFTLAQTWSIHTLGYLGLMTLGNSCGSLAVAYSQKLWTVAS